MHIRTFYMYIDDLNYELRILKQRHETKYDFSLVAVNEDISSIFRGCFKFDECTGKIKIIKIYENDILGVIS